ncbi:hypothetical protein [uncultured Flavobacterium sp.]|jgi:hypothetical protein|uniref:hypothetical protein n=1 Tax=uncultured Flavobacterium sp. TaxID=165435 RepID=UPI0030ED48E2|tara:strand:+ start:118 stop:504 length:387 start_codon:yes stop_codon:yes gene_type:complete
MKKFNYILIFFSFFLNNCIAQDKNDSIILGISKVTECNGKTIELILPKNWNTPDRLDIDKGFIQTYIYPDKSYISFMCGDAELHKQKNIKEGEYAREEKYNGFSIIYGNVKADRKDEFDEALNRMKSK